MNTVLGGTASARLFMNLRERQGFTYGAYSSLDVRQLAGSFRSTAEVRTPVTGASLREFFLELNRIRDEAVGDQELTNARSYLTGVFPIRLETQEGLIDQLVQIKMYGLPADYLQTYRERINAVTAADVQRVARQYITPDKVAIVVVGDANAIMDQIRPYSQTIEVYDSNGARRQTPAAGATAATPGAGANTGSTTTPSSPASGATSATAFAGMGSWSLEITGPGGQAVPGTLTLRREGDVFVGNVQTQLGDFPMSNITTDGNSFEGEITVTAQGQSIPGRIKRRIEGERLSGELTLIIPNAPAFPFTGTRPRQ